MTIIMEKFHLYTKVKIIIQSPYYKHTAVFCNKHFEKYYYEQGRPDKNNNEQTNSCNARKFAATTRLARDILTSSHCF